MTPLARYAAFWAAIGPDSIGRLAEVLAPGARFKDPFNDVRGHDAIAAVLRHMFALGTPRFTILDTAEGAAAGYVRWRCVIESPRGATVLEGMSELRFDAEGLVLEHIDHWDAAEQFYERLPLLGAVMRRIKRRLAAG